MRPTILSKVDMSGGRPSRGRNVKRHPVIPAPARSASSRSLGLVDVGDALVAPTAQGDGVRDHAVVAAVRRRIHENRPLRPETIVERPEHLQRGIWRRVGPVRHIGIQAVRPEDVAMGIAGLGREEERRNTRVRMRRCDGGRGFHSTAPVRGLIRSSSRAAQGGHTMALDKTVRQMVCFGAIMKPIHGSNC